MALPPFDYIAPRTLEELAGVLAARGPRARILAGGTDLVLLLRERQIEADCLIDIGKLAALRGIARTADGGLTIGATTRIREVECSPLVREHYRALAEAAGALGSKQIRLMATLGGNACNASPAAETPPALIALGASVRIRSAAGERELPFESFITGIRTTALAPGEYLAGFRLPPPWPASASRYRYAGLREAMEIDLANVAVHVALDPVRRTVTQARIAMGAVGPVPLRARRAEEELTGMPAGESAFARAAVLCAAAARPIDDMRASAAYRRAVLKTLVRRTLADAAADLVTK